MHPHDLEVSPFGLLRRLLGLDDPGYAPIGPLLGPDGAPSADALFNTGGPRSRTRKERITASLFEFGKPSVLQARRVGDIWALSSPHTPLRHAAFEILAEHGFADPDEAFDQVENIPRTRLHCRSGDRRSRARGAARSWGNRTNFLRVALVLGKCCNGLYDPARPVIWTEGRLGQWLELYEIGKGFYR